MAQIFKVEEFRGSLGSEYSHKKFLSQNFLKSITDNARQGWKLDHENFCVKIQQKCEVLTL